MKLTTKGRYAVLALTDLALERDEDFVKISAMTEVSPNDLACKRKQDSQLCGILIAAHSKAA